MRPLLSLALFTPFWKRVILVGPIEVHAPPTVGAFLLWMRAASFRTRPRASGLTLPPIVALRASRRPIGDSALSLPTDAGMSLRWRWLW